MTTATQAISQSATEYFAAPGLSNSGLKDLAVSPLRFWHLHINPNRPADEPTPEMVLGSALHCLVLEPAKFDERYTCKVQAPEGCLVTIDDMRGWLKSHGVPPKGTKKADIIAQVLEVDLEAPILELLERRHAEQNEGKIFLRLDDWTRVHACAKALTSEPRIIEILAAGISEVSMFAKDPETGVLLKSRLDWMTPKQTLDLKTFAQKRGKSIDKSVTDAIWYEKYFQQAYFYSNIRALNGEPRTDFVMGFVESDPPHETRLKVLRATTAGQPNLYWNTARLEVRSLIKTYADCVDRFGDKPWRSAQDIDPLIDEEFPGLAW